MSFLDETSNWLVHLDCSPGFQFAYSLAYSSLNPGKTRITFSFEAGMKEYKEEYKGVHKVHTLSNSHGPIESQI